MIKIQNLNKSYDKRKVINNVCLNVKKGDIYGLIGRNGAGKTTLMKLILGLTQADDGTITINNGEELSLARKKIGSIIEEPGLYYGKTAFENMKLFSLLYEGVKDEEIKSLLNRVGLGETGKKKVKGFSLGMKQRLGIAIAMMGKPDILILDEPINGLDPMGIKEIRDMILEMNAAGITFMISSHLLDELGKIVTRYGIMSNGELVEEITAEELNKRCTKHVEISVDNKAAAIAILKKQFENVDINETELKDTFYIMSEVEDTSLVNSLLVNNGVKVYSIYRQGSSLEDYFIERLGA
ncbi:MAG: ATP-binding cassette domain-containing protein [Lachnospiraceae bacterium]|nr:ATP-binding cassette domain-containing protein [Lachnospiraceae bacterium]